MGLEVGEVFPEEVSSVDDLAPAHVEEIDGEHLVFIVEAEDIGIFVVRRGDALLIAHLMDSGDLITQTTGRFEEHVFGGCGHSLGQPALQLVSAAFKEEANVADSFGVGVGGDEAVDAGAEAALDVVLQAGARMIATEVDFAAGYEEAAVDEIDQAMGQVAREVGAEVGTAILPQTAGYEDLGITIVHSELDIRVGFVVAEQDVEAWLALLDEVVFKGKGFALVVDGDVFDVDGFPHERAGLAVVDLVGFEKVGANAGAKVLCLADVDDHALSVFIEIAAGGGGKGTDFLQ